MFCSVMIQADDEHHKEENSALSCVRVVGGLGGGRIFLLFLSNSIYFQDKAKLTSCGMKLHSEEAPDLCWKSFILGILRRSSSEECYSKPGRKENISPLLFIHRLFYSVQTQI